MEVLKNRQNKYLESRNQTHKLQIETRNKYMREKKETRIDW